MPNPSKHSWFESTRLSWEIALALTLKIILLGALWFAVFKPDPHAPKATVADLFERSTPFNHPEETPHVR